MEICNRMWVIWSIINNWLFSTLINRPLLYSTQKERDENGDGGGGPDAMERERERARRDERLDSISCVYVTLVLPSVIVLSN